MVHTWQTGHPWQMLCFCSTRRSPTHSSPGAGTPKPIQTWPSPKSSGKSHSQYGASWTSSLTPKIACHWSQHHRLSSRWRGNLSWGGTFTRPTGQNLPAAPTPQSNPCQCLLPPTSMIPMCPTAQCWPTPPRNTSHGESERTTFPSGTKSARNPACPQRVQNQHWEGQSCHRTHDTAQHQTERERWTETVKSINFTHSSQRVCQTINKLTGQTTKPKPCPITADSITVQLISNGRFLNADNEFTR